MNTHLPNNSIPVVSEKRRTEILARIAADRANRPQRIEEMKERQKAGLKIAQQAAKILKEQFHVTKVVLFGSLLVPEDMYERSDIDIAVWGLASDQFFTAWAAIETCLDDSSPFPHIDLVPIEDTAPYIQRSIKKAHIEL